MAKTTTTETTNERRLPSVVKSVATKAGDHTYNVDVRLFASLEEAREIFRDAGHNPDEVLLGILNSAQEQNAKQGGKDPVRQALAAQKAAETDEARAAANEALEKAIAAHQASAAEYVIGAPRDTSGPIKGEDAKKLGQEIAKRAAAGQALSPEDLAALLGQFGLTSAQ